jgi:hypothetical protein
MANAAASTNTIAVFISSPVTWLTIQVNPKMM